ncbi:hypothetical protein ASD04_13655 [Devosia sp. Root436]|jgi:hypothetical protein|uniref:hypothetical protein n=1 Tax=Devosia sp. Root436 TaxID=1736537 RepID=UPI0006F56874|nr:hypothetical protein [Devosia sp. Root436]KQX35811.1 hypothetical protein ASD04_13655 [Devosia sp. Root436]
MKTFIATLTTTLLLASPAFADGKIYVQLPDLSSITGAEAEAFLSEVVLANVVSSNCPDFAITDEEWSLLTDSADILAREQLRLSVDEYDSRFYGPAFDALDRPETCAEAGPGVQPTLDRLVELGGSRAALPDQDAAYAAEQARQASWDAPAATQGKTKTK